MKKILGLLGSIALVVPASSSIVACDSVKKLKFANGKSVNDLVKFANNGFIDIVNKKNLKNSECFSKLPIPNLTQEDRKNLKGAGDILWFSYWDPNDDGTIAARKFSYIKNLFNDLNNISYISLIDEYNRLESYFSVDNAKENGSTFTLKLIQIHVKFFQTNQKAVGYTFKGCKVLYKTTINLNLIK